ncbi:MAG: methionyl-tRNA formyltransferase [Desulfatiglans sp.]|jgi:methionyl-tRNA formyltransferase|nr:methionyl-tRNA formyltransferase [Thermodesulfobacteriota bacterium]MEE4351970.1 methionyl-tRNA formyltransferase [Desulfatiglans sp.]
MTKEPRAKLPHNPRIVFMGTPDFSVPSLQDLLNEGYDVVAVVTQPDRPKGRGRKVLPSSVKQAAMERDIRVLQPQKAWDRSFLDQIGRLDPDLLVVVAFGQILKKELLTKARYGGLNIHASLLPKYRGPAPIHWAILKNETGTGLTAMRMDVGLDTGPILLQEEVPIHQEETAGQLHDRLARISGAFLVKTLRGLAEGSLEEIPQDEEKATYAPKIDRSMSLIDWDKPARDISSLIRALDPWPGAYTTFKGKKIKLFSSKVKTGQMGNPVPGRISGHGEGGLEVETSNGLIQIREMQVLGKRRLRARNFLTGFPLEKGLILGR